MHQLPADWGALCALVFLLGLRHGFDADHLAAINGLIRLASHLGQAHARWCGALFSLGHGLVVVAVAALVGALSAQGAAPAWLALSGAWVSIGFLLLLGTINLRAVLAAEPGQVVALVGLKGPLARLVQASSPQGVAAVGALFALSLDTITQAALFAGAAARWGGVGHAVLLGVLFMLGMLAADGLNGWWVARLLSRADAWAVRASRVMSLAVACISLLLAAWGMGRLLWPALDNWGQARGSVVSGLLLLVLSLCYLTARALARHAAPRWWPQPAPPLHTLHPAARSRRNNILKIVIRVDAPHDARTDAPHSRTAATHQPAVQESSV